MKKIFLLLFLPFICLAQTDIYRSVQPNNTSRIADNENGTRTITISNDTLYVTPAVADSIGIGVVIQYDANNDGTLDNLAFIHKRINSSTFIVNDSLGATPNSVTGDDSSAFLHAYTTLAGWENGDENTGIDAALRNFDPGNRNIVTANERWFVCLYRGTLTTGNTTISWTTGTRVANTGNRILIFSPKTSSQVGVSQHHNGNFNSGFRYICNTAGISAIQTSALNSTANIEVNDIVLQTYNSSTSSSTTGFSLGLPTNGIWVIKNCIIKGKTGGTGADIAISSGGQQVKISNCYIFGLTGTTGTCSAFITGSTVTAWIYNVTINDCDDFGINRTQGTVTVKNSIVSADNNDFNGTITQEYNASSDATASGTGSRINQTFSFIDAANGDFRLAGADTAAKNLGEDLSLDSNLPITDDILGTARPVFSLWDIGANETLLALYEVFSGYRKPSGFRDNGYR